MARAPRGEGALPSGSCVVSLTLPAHHGCAASLLLPSPICRGCMLSHSASPSATRVEDCPLPGLHTGLCILAQGRALATSQVACGLVHPRPPPPELCTASSTLPKVAHLTASTPTAGREVGVWQSGWGHACVRGSCAVMFGLHFTLQIHRTASFPFPFTSLHRSPCTIRSGSYSLYNMI